MTQAINSSNPSITKAINPAIKHAAINPKMSPGTNTMEAIKYADYDQPAVIFDHGMSLRDIEKSVILETLKRQKYNRTRTARVLGIGIRTLQRKLKQYRESDRGLTLEITNPLANQLSSI